MKPPIEYRPKRIAPIRDSSLVIRETRSDAVKGRPEIGSGEGNSRSLPSEPKTRRQTTPIAPKPEIATGAQNFDKTAYQRDYMRRYRAKKKEGK